MRVVRVEDGREVRWPCRLHTLHQPLGMRGAHGNVGVYLREQLVLLARELAKHRVHETRGAFLVQNSCSVYRCVHRGMSGIARVLDLMRAGGKQCQHFVREPVGPFEQRLERTHEPQMPAHRAERDGANRRTLGVLFERRQCVVRRAPSGCDSSDGACRGGERFGAGSPAAASAGRRAPFHRIHF